MAIYKVGSKGQKVKKIQRRLKELEFYRGRIDGDYGPGTERAVRAFQRSRDLGVDGKVGPNTWETLFEAAAPAGPAESPEPAPAPPPFVPTATDPTGRLNLQRLEKVHPVLAIRGRSLIELCAQAGFAVLITQGLRTWEQQDRLYAKGRTVAPIGTKYIVTKAKGGQSFHNFGLAFDIVILDSIGKADWDTSNPAWKKAGDIGRSIGLEWGGAWRSFKDLPHFQYVGGLAIADCRRLYEDGGLPAVWEKIT